MAKINFFTEGNPPGIKFSKTKLRTIAQSIFADHEQDLTYINFIFCDDEYILDINKTHLNHDFYTDIITFDYDDHSVESDVYISTERVIENANSVNVTPTDELYRVMFHGCIHLCGFGDKSEEEVVIMRSKEDQYLRIINDK